MRRGASVGTPGPDSGFALRLAHRFEHELQAGRGRVGARRRCWASPSSASKRAALFGRAPVHLRRPARAQPVGLPRSIAPADLRAARRALFSSVSHDYVAQRALVDSVPEETLRLSPDEARARGRYRRRLGARARALVVDAIGAIDRLEIEAGGFTFTRPGLRPARGPPVLLLHGFPQTSWAWRDELWALGRGGLPGRGAGPAGLLRGARPPDGGRLRHRAPRRATSSTWPTPWTWRPSTWSATTGAACSAGCVAARHPGRVRTLTVVSTPHPLALREALLGATTRRRRRTARRDWMRSARPRCPSGCCWAPTGPAAASPRCWPRAGSTTRTPGCTWPRWSSRARSRRR